MLNLYCDVCSGVLELSDDMQVAVCPYCGKKMAVPRGYSVQESRFLFARNACIRREFKEAENTYNEILMEDPDNYSAYWGIALARYGVEYHKVGNTYQMICNKANLRSFEADEDAKKAIRLAPPEKAAIYQKDAKDIAKLQRSIASVAAREERYDIYIVCSDKDSDCIRAAERVAEMLRKENYKVLFPYAEEFDRNADGVEPYIFLGIQTAKMMIAVATGKHAFTEEMKFDILRFTGQSDKSLYIAYSQLDEYEDIPDAVFDRATERLNMDSFHFADELSDLVSGKDSWEEEAWVGDTQSQQFSYTNMLNKARLALEEGDFREAWKQYNAVLDVNARESQAYWGLLLAELRCRNDEELIKKGKPLWDNINFKNAIAFASERQKQIWTDLARRIQPLAKKNSDPRAAEETKRKEAPKQNYETRSYTRKYRAPKPKMSFGKKVLIYLAINFAIIIAAIIFVMLYY